MKTTPEEQSPSSRILLMLTLSILTMVATDASAQDCGVVLNQFEQSLSQMELKADHLEAERDRALAQANESRRDRIRCEGGSAELAAAARTLRITVDDYEETIAKLEDRPSGAFWYAIGFATPLVATIAIQIIKAIFVKK